MCPSMNRSILSLLIIAFIFSQTGAGQDHQQRYEAIDVLSYRFEVDLNDTTDIIQGTAQIEILFKRDVPQFYLDLKNRNSDGIGMVIEMVLEDGIKIKFCHLNDRINFTAPKTDHQGSRVYTIKYKGIPRDGLIISENKFGDRTFFGDNWPNRAHHWLPVVDHPSDKALVEFLVHAPGHYRVVANGTQIQEGHEDNRIFSHWASTVPIPTKLMVIGVSPFAVQYLKSVSGVPVSTWVYPQNKEEGFYDYSIATKPLEFFESYIAPYPFSKLANVQSKTVYGGMENASCIFYSESTVDGKQEYETLFAHEIAHQWFGDAVSELNWHHVWISEGFATYLTDLYLEHALGRDAFVASMQDERQQVLRYSRKRFAPIVDTTLTVSVGLLNTNSYEKAGWVLHMLRREIGDEQFQECIRTFYEKFKYNNALTGDFKNIVETVTGKNFTSFFHQWFRMSGHPVLSSNLEYKRRVLTLTIKQHQEQEIFEFPLDIEIIDVKGASSKHTLVINAQEQIFKLKSKKKPARIILDPDTWLLFEHY